MLFEVDSNWKQHTSININLPELAGNKIDEIMISGYDETKKDLYFRGLDFVYKNAYEIFNGCCEMVKECYDGEEVRDDNNELFCIETIRN